MAQHGDNCSVCGKVMYQTQVYATYADYCDDGPYVMRVQCSDHDRHLRERAAIAPTTGDTPR